MDVDNYFGAHLASMPVIGIFRSFSPERTVELCQRAWDFGVTLVEIPVQDPAAIPSLEAAIAAGRKLGKEVGAGTITSVEQLELVQKLGATFTVAPGLDIEVVQASHSLKLPHLPGIATSSEIGAALKYDLTWLKAFPAAQLGPEWITAQLAPFPTVNFVATGGIGPDNAQKFLAAGCRAVAVGSAFADESAIERLGAALGSTVSGIGA